MYKFERENDFNSIVPFVSEWAHDTAGDADLGIVFHSGKEWVKVSKGEQVCGYLSIVANHGCYVEVHPFISTSVKGQGVKILQKFIDWLDSWLPTCYGSIITKSPETYKHIEKIAYFLNFKKIGEIKNGFVKNGIIQNMVIYQRMRA